MTKSKLEEAYEQAKVKQRAAQRALFMADGQECTGQGDPAP